VPTYVRTAIESVRIRGFRSIANLELEALPPLLVFFGPNGSGKSNILRAVRLLLRAVGWATELPLDRADAISLNFRDAAEQLNLRPEDFRRGETEIRISLTISLGDRARERILPPGDALPAGELVRIDGVFQAVGPDALRFYCDRAQVGSLSLGVSQDARVVSIRAQLAQNEIQLQQMSAALEQSRAQETLSPANRALFHNQAVQQARALDNLERAADTLRVQLGEGELLAERIRRSFLAAGLLQASDVYRQPDGKIEEGLFARFLSRETRDYASITRLGERLRDAGLFSWAAVNGSTLPITLRPAEGPEGKQILIMHPTAGELPLSSLGSGEQQLILMLADRVVTPNPVSQLEEPEAHLHIDLMRPLARVLHSSVVEDGTARPDVDQLWIATHHHLFAISEEFFDTRLENGETKVARKPRAMAATHFYEPGPLWDALKSLLDSGLDRGAVLFRRRSGDPVTVGEIEESERSAERSLFNEWAAFASEQVVLSMKANPQKAR
jgi:hypothetical protein